MLFGSVRKCLAGRSLEATATTTPGCGPTALLAAGGQKRTPPSFRHKIQLKDEVAKRSPTSQLLDGKRLP
jgi:hypothetical protein